MAEAYKPKGYQSAAPYIVASDAAALLGFLADVFGGEVTRQYQREDGSIAHAETKIDDTIIMIGQSGGDWQPVTAWVHVYVQDAEAVHEKAIAAGAKEMFAPEKKPDDTDLRSGFTDPWGNCWFPATQMEEE